MNEVLAPFLDDYQQRYSDLNTERVQLQAELDVAKQELAAFNASGDTVSVLKSQVSSQQSEIGSLKASLQNATNGSSSWQQKFLLVQSQLSAYQSALDKERDEYAVLYDKLSVVNAHTSDTVNGFTAEEKATFYKVWDEWWDLVVVGAD